MPIKLHIVFHRPQEQESATPSVATPAGVNRYEYVLEAGGPPAPLPASSTSAHTAATALVEPQDVALARALLDYGCLN